MDVGTTSINLINDGTILLDGGSLFGPVPKVIWEQQLKPDRRNRIRLGLNCMLIQTPSANILVDTGIGSKRPEKLKEIYGANGNKLLKEIKKYGVSARDIDIVVLTHLHFESAGGCTKIDRTGKVLPTFPKAKYVVQQSAWQEANNPDERSKSVFHEADFLPLEEIDALSTIDGDTEIAQGIRTKVTNGHSVGHQIILAEIGSERIAFLGAFIPTPQHLPLNSISAFDQSPTDTFTSKHDVLRMAVDEGWLLVFGHALGSRAGYVEQRNGRSQFIAREF